MSPVWKSVCGLDGDFFTVLALGDSAIIPLLDDGAAWMGLWRTGDLFSWPEL